MIAQLHSASARQASRAATKLFPHYDEELRVTRRCGKLSLLSSSDAPLSALKVAIDSKTSLRFQS
jgi:hypothetical protein